MGEKEKKKRRPKHTGLVLPGESSGEEKEMAPPTKDRLGRTTAPSPEPEAPGQEKPLSPLEKAALQGEKEKRKAPPKHSKPKKTEPRPAAGSQEETGERMPANAILMPQPADRGLSAAKKKKRNRRLRFLSFLGVVVFLFFFYVSGLYLNMVMTLSELSESIKVAAQRGDGFPIDFSVTGYITAKPMGGSGFAVLGTKDMAIVSSTGKELNRIQHGYAVPGITTSNTRVCVYARGGYEYTLEGRTQQLIKRTTENEILFAELSPKGWLALVTGTQYRSTLEIYSPSYNKSEPVLRWSRTKERPVLAAFHNDNRTLVLGCLDVEDGALGSVLYILKTGSTEKQAEIRAANASLLQAKFLNNGTLLAVYDSFAAVYSIKGQELYRYDYGGRNLHTSDVTSGKPLLLFGGDDQEHLELVMLDETLQQKFAATADNGLRSKVLSLSHGAVLMTGQEITAYDLGGTVLASTMANENPNGLVYGGQPLLITPSKVESLQWMFEADQEESRSLKSVPPSGDRG